MAAADLARALMETNGRAAAGAGIDRRSRAPALERALPWGVEQDDVARAGWGVVFHQDESEAVRRAIQPLVAHRAKIGGDARVIELTYQTGETATAWLARHGVSWHNVDPERVPYYLLWVGPPERMPFDVTHEVDANYASACCISTRPGVRGLRRFHPRV